MKAKIAICAVAAICAFVTVPASATLTVIGTATYDGTDYNLVWDDDNGSGTEVVYLDYDYSYGVGILVNHPDAISWADGLGATLTINLLPGHSVTWSGDWRLPAVNASIELGDLDNAECPDAYTLMDAWPAPAFNRFWVGMSATGQIYQQPENCGSGGTILQHDNPNDYDNGAIAVRSASEVITEPGAIIKFESADSGDLETVTPAEITVLLANPEQGQTYTVDYAITGGSATGCGVDYHSLFSPCYLLDLRALAQNWLWTGPGFNRADFVTDGKVDGFDFSFFANQWQVEKGTLIFLPGQTSKTSNINIMDDDEQESNETIEITLSNPTGPDVRLGTITQHTYTIIDPNALHLKVDFAMVHCPDTGTIRPETAKAGWWHWAAPGWADMYAHDLRWEDGGDTKPTDSGIDGSGVHAAVTLILEGDLGLKASGLTGALGGGVCPTDSTVHEPICNTWLQCVDWPEFEWGSIQLVFHDLPAGEYELYSYHNHFGCYRGDEGEYTPVTCDCLCNPAPPMPEIRAMSCKEARELPYQATDPWSKLFPGIDWTTGPWPEGVTSIQEAYNVQPQQVTTDAELVPSLIKFSTDGSPVLILYKAGCCEPDPVRPTRVGGRGILNAFEIRKIN